VRIWTHTDLYTPALFTKTPDRLCSLGTSLYCSSGWWVCSNAAREMRHLRTISPGTAPLSTVDKPSRGSAVERSCSEEKDQFIRGARAESKQRSRLRYGVQRSWRVILYEGSTRMPPLKPLERLPARRCPQVSEGPCQWCSSSPNLDVAIKLAYRVWKCTEGLSIVYPAGT
jgi:hypothetical protein